MFIMTSSNGNIFRVTGPLCGNSPNRSPVNSPHKNQWRGALMFSLICARKKDWVNNREAGDWKHHRAHYADTVMYMVFFVRILNCIRENYQKSMRKLLVTNSHTKRIKYMRPFSFHCTVSELSYMSTGMYYRLSIYRSYIWYDSAHSTITIIKPPSDLHTLTKPHTLRPSYGCLSWVMRRNMTSI